MEGPLVATWRAVIRGDGKSWVLFANGTCVILTNPQPDLAARAVAILREWGPVHAGSSAGDFSVIHLSDHPGWVVTSHHNDVLTYVAPDEVGDEPSDLVIGLTGRSKRGQDAEELRVLHVEDRRATADPAGGAA
ncbi:MAG TPA: hypothetical protein VF796_13870 [Humisphaera sp.]